ncbi:hypothetical protein BDZ45DRAFT_728908 [Acephala macrosclerotiorum]|nr:hypothetical protein BDZ45DRAFT_728908 [Acephala macrosclerotiorum]
MAFIDGRAQLVANCKFLYGPDAEVLTLSHDSGYQAVAIRFDTFTASWTQFLHTMDTSSTNDAILCLLRETEIEIAKRFSANGISIPCLGKHSQNMSLHPRVQGHSGASSSTRSDHSGFEFVATPRSSLSDKESVRETRGEYSEEVTPAAKEDIVEETPCEPCEEATPTLKENIIEEPAQLTHEEAHESVYEEHFRAKDVLDVESTPKEPNLEGSLAFEPELQAPEGDGGWGSLGQVKNDKTKKFLDVNEEAPAPKPEPAAVFDDLGRGAFSSRNDKKGEKGKKGLAEEEALAPEPEPEPEPAAVVDDFGLGSVTKKDKKKKGKREEKALVSEPDDSGLGSFTKKDKKKKGKKEGKGRVSEPEPDDFGLGFSSKKGKKKKAKNAEPIPQEAMVIEELVLEPIVEDLGRELVDTVVSEDPTPAEELFVKEIEAPLTPGEPFVEAIEPPLPQEIEEPSIATTSLLGPLEVTTGSSQPLAGYTIVLNILYTSKTAKQTLRAMVTLEDNTRRGIFSAVNLYLDSRTPPAQIQNQRTLEIKYGAGKDGDLELSALDENMWPEYLEYFRQYTKFPELTIDVVDG